MNPYLLIHLFQTKPAKQIVQNHSKPTRKSSITKSKSSKNKHKSKKNKKTKEKTIPLQQLPLLITSIHLNFKQNPKKKKKLSKTRTKPTKKFCNTIQNTRRKSTANK
jgi:hypothetical protein